MIDDQLSGPITRHRFPMFERALGPACSQIAQRSYRTALFPDSVIEYRVWQDDELKRAIRKSFGVAAVTAYESGLPVQQKAQMARYFVLYLHGGLYCDFYISLAKVLAMPQASGVAGFSDASQSDSNPISIHPGLLWSEPGRSEWTFAIEMLLTRRHSSSGNGSYSVDDLGLLGQAFATASSQRGHQQSDDQFIGQVRSVPGQMGCSDLAFVMPTGEIVAFHFRYSR